MAKDIIQRPALYIQETIAQLFLWQKSTYGVHKLYKGSPEGLWFHIIKSESQE
jgi:hypothetical protein